VGFHFCDIFECHLSPTLTVEFVLRLAKTTPSHRFTIVTYVHLLALFDNDILPSANRLPQISSAHYHDLFLEIPVLLGQKLPRDVLRPHSFSMLVWDGCYGSQIPWNPSLFSILFRRLPQARRLLSEMTKHHLQSHRQFTQVTIREHRAGPKSSSETPWRHPVIISRCPKRWSWRHLDWEAFDGIENHQRALPDPSQALAQVDTHQNTTGRRLLDASYLVSTGQSDLHIQYTDPRLQLRNDQASGRMVSRSRRRGRVRISRYHHPAWAFAQWGWKMFSVATFWWQRRARTQSQHCARVHRFLRRRGYWSSRRRCAQILQQKLASRDSRQSVRIDNIAHWSAKENMLVQNHVLYNAPCSHLTCMESYGISHLHVHSVKQLSIP